MTKQQKRIERLLAAPSDYTWSEAQALLERCGYLLEQSGGSHVTFVCRAEPNIVFHISKPHNRNPPTLLRYQIKQLIEFLRERGHI